MKVSVYSQKGNKLKKEVDLNDVVFGAEINPDLLSQYVYVYNSNQRQNFAHTKDRSEVRGGGRKPWRQKGTGRARHGSNRSPIWVGGGATFGPRNEKNFKKKLPKKMKQAAMRSALSAKVATEELKVLSKIEIKDKNLTKQATEFAKGFSNPRKYTLVTAEASESVTNAFNNLDNANVVFVGELNAYDVLNAGELFVEEAALDYFEKWAA